jgi:excisionase family DNA binding protein
MYISMNEAAARLGITRQWLWKLARSGKITTLALAGRNVVVVDDIFKAEEKRRRKAGK